MAKVPGNRRLQPGRAGNFAKLAIIFLGCYLVLLFVSGLALVRLIAQMQERFLPDYLELVGRAITDPPRDYFWVLEFLTDAETGELSDQQVAYYSARMDWQNLADSLRGAAGEVFIQSAFLLTTRGQVILDSTGTTPADLAVRNQFLQTDKDAITAAAKGAVVSSRETELDQKRFVYMPVKDSKGKIVALLRLATTPEQFMRLSQMRNRMTVGFLISAGVLVILYIVTIRLVRRTLEAERAAAQADRLRALGTLTAGIAHEIRNPLGILMLQIEELRALIARLGQENGREALDSVARELEEETKRLKDLTSQFLSFGNQEQIGGGATCSGFDARPVLTTLCRLWSKGLDPHKRETHIELGQTPLPVVFNPDALRQVVLNLLRNADEALGDRKGRIDIGAVASGETISITIADDGPGIDPAIAEQIFDPFFSTHVGGTGLGLSISRSLARTAGGDLLVDLKGGKGARFRLTLPRDDAPKEADSDDTC